MFTIEYKGKTFEIIDVMEIYNCYYFLAKLDRSNKHIFTNVLNEMGENVKTSHHKLEHLYKENYKGCKGLVPYDIWAEGNADMGRFTVDNWKPDSNKILYESLKDKKSI